MNANHQRTTKTHQSSRQTMSHTVWTRELRVSYLAQGVRLFGDSAKQCLQQLVLQFSCQQQQSCLHILALHILCSAVCVLCAVSVIDKKKKRSKAPPHQSPSDQNWPLPWSSANCPGIVVSLARILISFPFVVIPGINETIRPKVPGETLSIFHLF